MSTETPKPVVVGVDGTQGSLDAVAWAADAAALRKAPLRLVHAFAWPLLHIPTAMWEMGPEGGLRAHADSLVEEAVRTARDAAPDIEIATTVETDFPLPLLVDLSGDATYVVVGTAGRGSVADALAGSLTIELSARSQAPVVVVRGTLSPERADNLVVVGVDGSPLGAVAVEAAVQEAARRHARLLAVHVVRQGRGARSGAADTAAGLRLLEESLAGWRHKYPDLPIEERVLMGHAAGHLIELSASAGLVVVGARGRGGFTGMLLGSVSQALLHQAQCPVVVLTRECRASTTAAA
ncbi:Nucleotide-binding universal stress protein, UspA family [Actinopolymorpha cephalotaxi]|uniref:Nucleotide-binding universal stress UspA family protein n=1 Tax=Actinopolymorpha cephalotaxi TaxID=504797 RepID=A0A1I2VM40_9ACTN|nr:universal stress protein [Actinopolymorpha cephalotaxi]NYH83340.1 nucleotide-binding universal stress UspA family protein [Actinopolymorpha cephalotaxi]SFG88251.1 Nucleotide-binding universal stress protein, UspA family [Actinopolymorpha cephalotaxi]